MSRIHPTQSHDACPLSRRPDPHRVDNATRLPVSLSTFLVEDNPLIQTSLILAMEELVGASFVGVAATEAEAIAWLDTHDGHWNLAVVDLFLGEGSGLGVVKRCRDRRPDQRLVVLTNYANAEIARKALALGADALFDKSTDLDAFFDFCMKHKAALSNDVSGLPAGRARTSIKD